MTMLSTRLSPRPWKRESDADCHGKWVKSKFVDLSHGLAWRDQAWYPALSLAVSDAERRRRGEIGSARIVNHGLEGRAGRLHIHNGMRWSVTAST
jgi:hypothetical protein